MECHQNHVSTRKLCVCGGRATLDFAFDQTSPTNPVRSKSACLLIACHVEKALMAKRSLIAHHYLKLKAYWEGRGAQNPRAWKTTNTRGGTLSRQIGKRDLFLLYLRATKKRCDVISTSAIRGEPFWLSPI